MTRAMPHVAATGERSAATRSRQQPRLPETMRAWVLDGPGELRLARKPVPVPGPAEALVRVDAVAICGTDTAWTEPFTVSVTSISAPRPLAIPARGRARPSARAA